MLISLFLVTSHRTRKNKMILNGRGVSFVFKPSDAMYGGPPFPDQPAVRERVCAPSNRAVLSARGRMLRLTAGLKFFLLCRVVRPQARALSQTHGPGRPRSPGLGPPPKSSALTAPRGTAGPLKGEACLCLKATSEVSFLVPIVTSLTHG